MKEHTSSNFFYRLSTKKQHFPLVGQIELTYRCGLNCIHCYCKGLEGQSYTSNITAQTSDEKSAKTENRELTTEEWKKILDKIHKGGCLWLTFTGGDPLVRDDFLEIYSYAKEQGFVITILTSGISFTDKIIDFFVKYPPHFIEITLNGITKETYETITGVDGSFLKVMQTIRLLAKRKLNLKLKTNSFKQNKYEITKIKAFAKKLLGNISINNYFGYDPMIYPRLNRDVSVCNFRLSRQELSEVIKQDPEIWDEFQPDPHLHRDLPELTREKKYLYQCNSWMNFFYINSFGRLKFCVFSDKFSVSLLNTSFSEGFYNVFPQLLGAEFKTDSKCKDCELRAICYNCPARAYLETGDEEAPVPYYCEWAKETAKQMSVASNR